MPDADSMPAWLVCDGIISKMRSEILSQAVSAMHEQLDKKTISLEGQLPSLNEGEGGQERDAFLLAQIVKEHPNIERRFGEYIERARVGKEEFSRVEELQRFLFELRRIVLLHDYSKECEAWIADAEKDLSEKNPVAIFVKTMGKNQERRRELLDYVLKSRKFEEEGVFSEGERSIMADSLRLSGN